MGKGSIYGLFVGVDHYESEDIRPLSFASADVLAVRNTMAERYGLHLENAVTLADNLENSARPSRREILRAMDRFSAAPMREDDLFLFVFAGHGFTCGGRTFLAASDSEIASEALLKETAVSLDSVRQFLAQIPAGRQVLILDACRDAPAKGTRSLAMQAMSDSMTRDISAVIQRDKEHDSPIYRSSAILCSCWEGQVAHEYPLSGHGWFCHNLLEELRQAADNRISIAELHHRVKERMEQSAWRLLPSARGQSPHLLIDGDIPELMLTVKTAPAVSSAFISPSAMEEIVRISCSMCGVTLDSDKLRCMRCGQVLCMNCRGTLGGYCARCAEMIQARTQKTDRPSPLVPNKQKSPLPHRLVPVPEGPFLMGRKRKVVQTSTFMISAAAITCAEYAFFLKETGYKPEGLVNDLLERRPNNHPVGNVTFADAEAFVRWAGYTLPMEIQWEKAARGTDGRSYPWGNVFESSRCNSYESGQEGTLPADGNQGGQSPFGCRHMAGNVWEWTASWYDAANTEHVVKGGSYLEGRKVCTCFYREGMDPRYYKPDLGFRCAKTI